MVERDDLVATYSVDYVAGVMSLRKPQKESLIRLEKIWNAADIRKGADRGMTALNDLKPILGFELTATPKTNKNGNIYLVAIKRNDQTDDEDVKAKRARTVTYCQKATTWANANGYKPWAHLFIPDNEVRSERLLADYVKMFTVKGSIETIAKSRISLVGSAPRADCGVRGAPALPFFSITSSGTINI